LANGPVSGKVSLDIGAGNATLMNAANNVSTLSVASANAVSVVNANALTLGAADVGTMLAQTLAGDLTLTGAINANGSGDAIVLVAARNFINAGGSLNADGPGGSGSGSTGGSSGGSGGTGGGGTGGGGSGRWLVYSTDPSANTLGGLTSDFKHYNCRYGAGCVIPATGDGLLYSLAPKLSISAAPVSIVYGGTSPALSYSVSGLIDGDTSASALTGARARNTGTLSGSGHESVGTYTIGQGSLAASLGYQVTFTGATYTISPRLLNLTAAAQGKIYDGTTAVTVMLSDDHIAGDAVTTTFANATFADRNVGAGKLVTVNGISVLGADAGNYTLQLPVTTTADITFRVPDGYTSAISSVARMEGQCAQYAQGGGNSSHCETSFQHADGLEQLPVAVADSGIRLPAGVPLTFSY